MSVVRCASGLILHAPPVDARRRGRLRRARDLVKLIARLRGEDPVDCLARLAEGEARRMTGLTAAGGGAAREARPPP